MQPDEVMALLREGEKYGCKEALFTLGDKPELRYTRARKELQELGHETTLSYLFETAGRVLKETTLLPHLNAGVMTAEDLRNLRTVSVSQGLMLESVSPRLHKKGGPHHGSPDKKPDVHFRPKKDACNGHGPGGFLNSRFRTILHRSSWFGFKILDDDFLKMFMFFVQITQDQKRFNSFFSGFSNSD